MNRSRPSIFRRTRRILVSALALLAGCFLLLNLLLPPVLEHLIDGALRRQGWEGASPEVRFVSLSRADLAGVNLGGGALRVDSIRVNYTLRSLLQRRVEDIELAGVQIRVPEVLKLVQPESSPASPSRPMQLPFRTVRLLDVRVSLEHGNIHEKIKLHGTVTAGSKSDLQAQVSVHSALMTMDAVAEADLEKMAWQVTFDNPLLRWQVMFARTGIPIFSQLGTGPSEARITVSQAGSGQPLRMVANLLQPLAVDGIAQVVRVTAAGSMDDAGLAIDGLATVDQDSIKVGDLVIAADQFELPFSVQRTLDQGVSAQARLVVDGLRISDPGTALHMGPIHADLSLPTDAEQTATGSVAVAEIQSGDLSFGGFRAETRLSFSEGSADLRTDLLTDTEISLQAVRGEDGLEVSLDLPSFRLETKEPLLALVKQIAGVDLSGLAEVHGVLNPRASFSATVSDIGIRQEGFSVEGLRGTVLFDDVARLRSRPHQQMKIDKLSVGKFELTEGQFTFAVEGKDQVFVEENRWKWAGGKLYSAAFQFRPSARRLSMDAVCEAIELQQVLSLAIDEQVTGKGDLYGRIPLSVGWNPYRFSIGEGYLFAAPGKGQIQIRDQQMVRQVIEAAPSTLAANKQGKQLQENIILSLKDFEYRALRLDFRQTDTGFPSGTMQIEGKGRDAQLGLPLDLTINFSRQENE